VVAHDVPEADRRESECFLCTLDPTKRACAQPEIEGRLIAVQERVQEGERIPTVLLETGASHIEVQLDGLYYRSLVKELKARTDVLNKLTLRIYHLPLPPTTQEEKGDIHLCYTGNAYTLAVLEPDMLLNITDLNQAEYCARQYLLRRLSPSSASPATIRGNLIHHCFKELLKEHDRGYFKSSSADQEVKSPLAILQERLDQALEINNLDMALSSVSDETMRAEVAPHLESLARWYETERDTLWDMPGSYAETQNEQGEQVSGNKVRAETFLLAPEIGLRGRLDLFWQQAGRQRLLELKTGGATGDLPKRDHRWQVYGYHALLSVRRDSQMKKALATLLYSGTPGSAQAIGIPATIREIQRVNERRNILVLSRLSETPPAPPGVSRCSKCSMLNLCQNVSTLLHWQQPTIEEKEQLPAGQNSTILPNKPTTYSNDDRAFFVRYYSLLQQEGRAGEQQQAQLWQTSVEERIERGTAIRGLTPVGVPRIERDGWEQCFRCANTSELREGDEILLSDGNPVTGEVVTGTIVQSSSEEITIWTRERITHPVLLDRYDSDIVHVRTLQNLLRWLKAHAHLRDLVAGRVRPRFQGVTVPARRDFNAEQNQAVERALQMQDYLLIHGPPGTGKTSVIAEIVKRLCAQNQRVLLAAFTNQAVDNILKRLDKEGFHEYIRLGHQRSVAKEIRENLLKELADKRYRDQRENEDETYSDIVRDLLYSTPVIASTTATWSAEKYVPATELNEHGQAAELGLEFDVAIIDEAGQLTIPAILGALRFARRFILVGDEKQLPPLVLSKEAAEQGLNQSLFSHLKKEDDDYMQDATMAIGACVALRTQYRMNKWIANFSSTVFYEKQLIAHSSIANKQLDFARKRGTYEQTSTALEQAIEPVHPLVFLDVRDDEVSREAKISNGEARAIRTLVAQFLKRGVAPQDIGVIAPYRAQVANIRRHLLTDDPASNWQGLPDDTLLSVDTVDRFQGGERMIILMSFATNYEPAEESQRRDFLTNPNRLNVALTRAQRKLIVLGSVAALEHLPYFERLITYCRSMKTVIRYIEEPVPGA